jgi:hypothetical protein
MPGLMIRISETVDVERIWNSVSEVTLHHVYDTATTLVGNVGMSNLQPTHSQGFALFTIMILVDAAYRSVLDIHTCDDWLLLWYTSTCER